MLATQGRFPGSRERTGISRHSRIRRGSTSSVRSASSPRAVIPISPNLSRAWDRESSSWRCGIGGEAYRVVYAVQLGAAVWVIHAFQKKAKSGIKTPKAEVDLVR